MGNLFDGLQAAAYNVVVTSMGYPATWTPSDGSAAQTGTVLLNKPTQKDDMSDEDYDLVTTKCEFLYGMFSGLFESVQAATPEAINIDGVNYNAYKADLKYDGKTVILRLEPSHQ
jgi:hypothetical protein